jgi:hypothetical protein
MAMAKEFDELSIDGHNYPTWASDIKINFASHGLLPYLSEPPVGVTLDEQKEVWHPNAIEVLHPQGSQTRVPYGDESSCFMACA